MFDLVPMTFLVFVGAGRAGENIEVAMKKFDTIFACLDANRQQVVDEFKVQMRNQAKKEPEGTNSNCIPFAEIDKKAAQKASLRN